MTLIAIWLLESPAFSPIAMAAAAKATILSDTTDVSARRRVRHVAHTVEHRGDASYYYDRPISYRPDLSRVPFFLGFGFSPSW